jgi:hypothetical protein
MTGHPFSYLAGFNFQVKHPLKNSIKVSIVVSQVSLLKAVLHYDHVCIENGRPHWHIGFSGFLGLKVDKHIGQINVRL